MTKKELTARQEQILHYIQECIAQNQCPPSVREIAEAVGLASPSTVHAHLTALEQKGYIHRNSAKSRSMSLVADGSKPIKAPSLKNIDWTCSPSAIGHDENVVTLPLIGRVAAGQPILAEENIEEYMSLPKNVFGDKNSYLLGVHGQSMIEAGINDGDIVIVRQQQSADNGQIVVALIDGEATIKTFYREKNCIRLQPQNSAMEPIFTTEAQIVGVVTGLFRTIL